VRKIRSTLLTIGFIAALASPAGAATPMDGAPLSKPLPQNLWVEMAKRVNPGVVGIFIDMKPRKGRYSRGNGPNDPLFQMLEEMFGGEIDSRLPNEPDRKSQPIGTGFVIRANGLVLTNYHVADAAKNHKLKVSVPQPGGGDAELADAEVIGTDKRGDIALLKVKTSVPLKPLQLGTSKNLQVGEYVAAFGNPFGHSNSMTVGIISAIGRNIKEINRFPFLQTDASINPGNSGGPLLNTQGYVIGVNTAIDARAQGIGFAIPVDYIKDVLPTLEKGQNVKRGYLGIGLATLSPRMASRMGIPGQRGVFVREVIAASPADKAGIEQGDVIIGFNKEKIRDQDGLMNTVQDSPVGVEAKVKVLRVSDRGRSTELTLPLKVGVFPDEKRSGAFPRLTKKKGSLAPKVQQSAKSSGFSSSQAPFDLGFGMTDSSSGARKYYDVPVNSPFGPIVTKTVKGSPASRAGLLEGDVLLEINGESAINVKTAVTLFEPKKNRIKVSRKGANLSLMIP